MGSSYPDEPRSEPAAVPAGGGRPATGGIVGGTKTVLKGSYNVGATAYNVAASSKPRPGTGGSLSIDISRELWRDHGSGDSRILDL